MHREAFDTGAEAALVRALSEDPSYVPELSIVAVDDGHVIGHALFTRMWVDGP